MDPRLKQKDRFISRLLKEIEELDESRTRAQVFAGALFLATIVLGFIVSGGVCG